MEDSLSIVANEMRHREQVQDAQIQALATKAAFLFTAGTTSIGASAAVVGLFLDRHNPNTWALLWPAVVAAAAYVWLVVAFLQAYRLRDFSRTPEPQQLASYLERPAEEVKELIADGRRYALQINAAILKDQTVWVSRELQALMIEIVALAATLGTLAFI